MKIIHMVKVRYFFYLTALSAGLGVATLAGAQVPYLVDLNSKTALRLGNFGPGLSDVHALNDQGQVVGEAFISNVATHAFITGPDGIGMRDLGTLGGLSSSSSSAYDINDAGQVAGESSSSQPHGHSHAFITGRDGMGMRDLGTLAATSARPIVSTMRGRWRGSPSGLTISPRTRLSPGLME